LLRADALGPLHHRAQAGQAQRRGIDGPSDLALHLAQHDAQDRALAFDDFAQALELPGVGVAAYLAP
jgi:hypothetical protein